MSHVGTEDSTLLSKRMRRVLAGVCTEYAVEVITTAITYTLGCACVFVERQQSGLLVTLCSHEKLSGQAALLILRHLLVAMTTNVQPTAKDLRTLVDELAAVARTS